MGLARGVSRIVEADARGGRRRVGVTALEDAAHPIILEGRSPAGVHLAPAGFKRASAGIGVEREVAHVRMTGPDGAIVGDGDPLDGRMTVAGQVNVVDL